MTIARARSLRRRSTDAEVVLWHHVRDRALDGLKFRRQVPVGPFTADFVCFEARLIVEVDGGQHAESVHDCKRDAWLTANDFEILRIWNSDVFENMEGVLSEIANAAGHRKAAPLTRPLRSHPLPRGERGTDKSL